jgi:hypothetical protein
MHDLVEAMLFIFGTASWNHYFSALNIFGFEGWNFYVAACLIGLSCGTLLVFNSRITPQEILH